MKKPADEYRKRIEKIDDILPLLDKIDKTLYDLRYKYLPWTSYSATISAQFDVKMYHSQLMLEAIKEYIKEVKR